MRNGTRIGRFIVTPTTCTVSGVQLECKWIRSVPRRGISIEQTRGHEGGGACDVTHVTAAREHAGVAVGLRARRASLVPPMSSRRSLAPRMIQRAPHPALTPLPRRTEAREVERPIIVYTHQRGDTRHTAVGAPGSGNVRHANIHGVEGALRLDAVPVPSAWLALVARGAIRALDAIAVLRGLAAQVTRLVWVCHPYRSPAPGSVSAQSSMMYKVRHSTRRTPCGSTQAQ